MSKALIIYGSTTGNTGYTAEEIERTFKEEEIRKWTQSVLQAI